MDRESLERRLKLYLEAEERILLNQSYSIGGRNLTRADLSKVQSMIESLTAQLSTDNSGRRKYAVFFDN